VCACVRARAIYHITYLILLAFYVILHYIYYNTYIKYIILLTLYILYYLHYIYSITYIIYILLLTLKKTRASL